MLDNPRGYLPEQALYRQPAYGHLFAASDNPNTPYTAMSAREVRFVLGSAALGEGFGIYAPANLDISSYPYHTWWYDEYAVDLKTGRSTSGLINTGWLGAPVGLAHQMVWVGTNPDASTNPDFESDLNGWVFNSFDPGASFTRVTDTAARGSASARVAIATPMPDYGTRVETTGRIFVTAGEGVSATFWAKAEAPREITLMIGPVSTAPVATARTTIGTTWQQYQVVLTPSYSSSVGLQFWLGDSPIDVWIDDVHLQSGTTSVYRRNFQNGIVLVNPGGTALTLPLERPYQKLTGIVDPLTNNGASVTQVTLQPSDALFLIGTDIIPPAAIGDMRVVPK
jgi:hypothetical protein